MSEQKKKKGFRFNPKLTITIVIVILVAALGIGLILNYHRNNDEQKITAKNAKTTAAASTAASTLPAEASDINSYTYLLNKDTASLDPTYVPSDLADPENVQSTSSVFEIRAEAATQLEAMVKAASDAGITLYVSSGYRSYDDQDKLYSSQVQLLTEAKAITACEKAGYSEHQLGLAVDLTDDVNTTSQTEAFADTDAGKWLYEHVQKARNPSPSTTSCLGITAMSAQIQPMPCMPSLQMRRWRSTSVPAINKTAAGLFFFSRFMFDKSKE